ncbi:glycosyltransferase family 2 protein [Rhodovulum marinum]|uniref:Dolichol-phosphate mannosyltransferase n=1 Tax=Rhodovulum marinum TaxID=320662 RepID=A0A4R2PUG1_9RHOB|nr:glycosyltransferase family 2 protein [Rhodovulum marinum]TCP39527.1 dolichol-phosphate mannosyltransferase [Rhodovulum marinum]
MARPESGKKISVLSPIYGCRDCLKALADRVRETFEGTELDWELVLVDDRGPDAPWDIIVKLAAADDRIRGIRLARNHGQHLAIWAGLAAATGDYVAIIDCDLQDDPTVIPDLYRRIREEQVDAVLVDRGSWSDSKFRRLASRSFYGTVKYLTGVTISNIGNFGLYSRRMVDTLLLFKEQEVFLPVMVSLTGLSTIRHTVDRDARHAGSSSYSVRRLLQLAVAIIIRFTDRPLKLSVIIGLIFSGAAAAISLLLLILWLMGTFTVAGWTSTILSMWFLSGLILATLGIHGFYLGRVFREVQDRPRILVETTTMESIAARDDRKAV